MDTFMPLLVLFLAALYLLKIIVIVIKGPPKKIDNSPRWPYR